MSKALVVAVIVVAEISTVAGMHAAWIANALAAARDGQNLPCLSDRDRLRISAGKFSQRDMDVMVVRQANRAMGQTNMLWWHVRGMGVTGAYLVFWSPEKRQEIFAEMVKNTGLCPSCGA
ncbi:hypothetical protein IHQ68_15510 [Chelatococcus sambhunathii]|uniref:Uncharacterized protein n=1 Tax=Chelatococcus sambhunathii TaxID=363953 RepID=A0ABU1DJ64_9HYPH|nr:hypothetical protein [Chelatococcus sambhunathii]MDR4308029.1 hypothetical protein [Chelatococcus sambhunathii]